MIEQLHPRFEESWWEIQTKRTISTDFLKKHEAFLEAGAKSLEDPMSYQQRRIKLDPDKYRERIGNYALVHDEVTSSLLYASTRILFGDRPGVEYKRFELGRSGYGAIPLVYTDASAYSPGTLMNESPLLTAKQKDIISAHELYHSLIDAETPYARQLFKPVLNFDALYEKDQDDAWLRSPDEIMSQMAEMKNYFGMAGDEIFTQEHMDYLKANYSEDTGFPDQSYGWHYPYKGRLGKLLTMVEAGDEPAFIELMNTLPV